MERKWERKKLIGITGTTGTGTHQLPSKRLTVNKLSKTNKDNKKLHINKTIVSKMQKLGNRPEKMVLLLS